MPQENSTPTNPTAHSGSAAQHVSIILLNWCAPDLAERCLESLESLRYPNFSVVLCDNNSPDGSFFKLASAMRLRGYAFEQVTEPDRLDARHPFKRWVLLQTGSNKGYAAGCNKGIEFARRAYAPAYYWLLNTDTLVHPDALTELVRRASESDQPDMVGSTLVSHLGAETTQACGGCRYRRTKGDGFVIGANKPLNQLPERAGVEQQMDWVLGASELIRADYVAMHGPMSEEYFLYCEEMDWALRGKAKLAWAPGSRVTHLGGGSTPSFISNYFFYRNSLWFSYKYFFWWAPAVYFHLFKRWIKSKFRGDKIKSEALSAVIFFKKPPELPTNNQQDAIK